MTVATSRLPHKRTHRADKVLVVLLVALGLSSILLLFGTVRAQAAPDSCLDSLPVPTPPAGLHRVAQLVNCSNQRVLGTANAAHVVNEAPTPVFPREKTWVMLPVGSPNHANVLTIDIPSEWENTSPKGSTGPNFWVRTGCRYDTTNGIAQCETGGCSGFYDCSKALLGPPVGATISEWTFYKPVIVKGTGTTYYLDYPDISAVNGVNLNMDVQPVGGSTADPALPNDAQWLAQNYPLTEHGADLRTPGRGLGQCIPELKRHTAKPPWQLDGGLFLELREI